MSFGGDALPTFLSSGSDFTSQTQAAVPPGYFSPSSFATVPNLFGTPDAALPTPPVPPGVTMYGASKGPQKIAGPTPSYKSPGNPTNTGQKTLIGA